MAAGQRALYCWATGDGCPGVGGGEKGEQGLPRTLHASVGGLGAHCIVCVLGLEMHCIVRLGCVCFLCVYYTSRWFKNVCVQESPSQVNIHSQEIQRQSDSSQGEPLHWAPQWSRGREPASSAGACLQ